MRYRNGWNGAALALWSLLTGPAWSAYKCVEEGGQIFYQDAPCPANARGGELSQNANRTFAGQASRPAASDPCCAAVQETATPPQRRKPGIDDATPDPPANPGTAGATPNAEQ